MSKRETANPEAIEPTRSLSAASRRGGHLPGGLARPRRVRDDRLRDALLHTFFARSTRTFEAIVRLGSRGFGEQVAMLHRSLFEDMVDAHRVSINRELALERLRQHHRYSNRLKRAQELHWGQSYSEGRMPP